MKGSENEVGLKEIMGKFMTGFAMSSAILEDYAKVRSKLEGIEENVVEERIKKRTREILAETRGELQKG